MSASRDTADMLHHANNPERDLEDAGYQAEQVADQAGCAKFQLFDARNYVGVKFVLDSSSLIEVKAMKQPDNCVVLSAVFRGSTPNPVAHVNPEQQIPAQEEERPQQDLGNQGNNDVTEDEWVKEMRGWLMVLATLVLSVTYQAGINPPGGVWQDDVPRNDTSGEKGHTAGVPINWNKRFYRVFKVSNTLAMVQSVTILLLLIKRSNFRLSHLYVPVLRLLIIICLMALVTAYSVSDSANISVFFVFYLLFACAFIPEFLPKTALILFDGSMDTAMKKRLWVVAKYCFCFLATIWGVIQTIILTVGKDVPEPWFNVAFGFLSVACTIFWVY